MSVAETLESIKFSVRIARQHAYLGLYEESSKAFERALNSIRTHYARLDDKILVNEWKSTENDVYNEMTVVNDVKNMVQGTKADSHNLETYEIYEDKGCHENFNPNEQKIVIPNEVKRYPFGKKPFQGQSRIGEEKPVNESQPYLNQEKPSQAKPAAQKDKDIWDPPSPKAKPKSFVKKPEPIQKRKPVVEKVSGQKVTDSVKPTKNEKKSYLYHCYPDGKGPDADLIQMLEKDVVDQNPNVQFDDIASLEEAKQILQETVLLPLLCPGLFVGIRRPWSGVLMFGPPGTGKTLLAKAVATLGKTTFFSITAGALTSKWRGESEKLVKILFEMARFYAPTTIFCDEIDALCSKRGGSGEHETSRRVISELLIQMDGMHTVTSASANEQANEEQKKTITVIGATNRPWDLDEAFRRRLEKRIYIPLPTEEGRKELFRINLKGIKLADDVDFPFLVKNTDGYSGADIASVCREAAMMPIRKKLLEGGGILNQLNDIEKLKSEMDVPITQKDFLNAIKNVRKSVSDTDLENYAKWMADFGAT